MNVVQPIGDAGGIVQVLQSGFPVAARMRIHHMHRGAGGAVMHPGAAQFHVMGRVAPVQHHVAAGAGQHVLDQRGRKAQPPVGPRLGAGRHHRRHPRGRGAGQADALERGQRRMVDALQIRLIQRIVTPARQPGAHRLQLARQGRGTPGAAGGTAT